MCELVHLENEFLTVENLAGDIWICDGYTDFKVCLTPEETEELIAVLQRALKMSG